MTALKTKNIKTSLTYIDFKHNAHVTRFWNSKSATWFSYSNSYNLRYESIEFALCQI